MRGVCSAAVRDGVVQGVILGHAGAVELGRGRVVEFGWVVWRLLDMSAAEAEEYEGD